MKFGVLIDALLGIKYVGQRDIHLIFKIPKNASLCRLLEFKPILAMNSLT